MGDPVRKLMVEGEAARVLLHNLRDILADDEEAKHDAIEGETNLIEAISGAIEQLSEFGMLADGIRQREKDLAARRKRLDQRCENIRVAVLLAMGSVDMRRLVLPGATLTVKATAPSVVVTDEAAIPSSYWKRADPTLDKKLLLDVLKNGHAVAGANLSNGSETLQVKVS